jgi:hypothetical protein
MLVRAKGRRRAQMPMPPDGGAAVVSYLGDGRPTSSCRRLFLRMLAPKVGFASGCAITMIAKTALERAGVRGYAHQGAHIFRHSLANRVYRDTFRLLFTFAQARLRKPPSALAIADAGLPLRSCGLSKKASPSAGRRHALWETQYSPIAQHRDRHEARAALVRPRRCRHCNQQTPPCQPSPLTARKNRNRHIVCPLICKSVGK